MGHQENVFAKRLKGLREKNGLLSKEMAQELRIANSTYSSYESGNRTPDNEKLITIAQLLHTSTDYLIGNTDKAEHTLPELDISKLLHSEKIHYKGNKIAKEDLANIENLLERFYQMKKM